MALESTDSSVRVDVGALHKLMGLAGELVRAREQFQAAREPAPSKAPAPCQAVSAVLALFATPDEGRMAILLSQVERIEEFDAAALYEEKGQPVVRYRGSLLPLLQVSGILPERRKHPRRASGRTASRAGRRVQVVVARTSDGRPLGLVVDRLVDVFEDRLELAQPGSRAGAKSSVVLRGRVTELADVDAMASHVAPDFWEQVRLGRTGPQAG